MVTKQSCRHAACVAVLSTLALLSACGGEGREIGLDPDAIFRPILPDMAFSLEPPGINCAEGGSRIDGGLDVDGDGALSVSEITTTQFVCNGTPGSASQSVLAQMVDEPAGRHCLAGGKAIQVGVDRNANGVLDADEMSTAYVCNGSSGSNGRDGEDGTDGKDGTNGTNGTDGINGLSTRAVLVPEPPAPGGNCPVGGSRLTVWLDANGNGQPDANEAPTTRYLCNGAPGLRWVDVTATTVQAQADTGYVARNDAAPVVVTLPAHTGLAVGAIVRVAGAGLGGWVLAQNSDQAVYTRNIDGMGGAVWTPHPVPEATGDWRAVACSADGRRLIATGSTNRIFTSANAGASWTSADEARTWTSVASSADGLRLAATASGVGAGIYTSVDGGASWLPHETGRSWISVASSADGYSLVTAAEGSGAVIYTSVDAGAVWTPRSLPAVSGQASVPTWVASSADGTRLAVTTSGAIFVSTDGGTTWQDRRPTFSIPGSWRAIASSADGNKLIAATESVIVTSVNGGVSWIARTIPDAGIVNWWSVASSADGSKVVAVGDNGAIFTSRDGGAAWTVHEPVRNRRAVAMSAAGDVIVAPDLFGPIYTSMATTTPGPAGSIRGTWTDAIELQYVGNGMFSIVSHEGDLSIQ